jgi:hypothetical protein
VFQILTGYQSRNDWGNAAAMYLLPSVKGPWIPT